MADTITRLKGLSQKRAMSIADKAFIERLSNEMGMPMERKQCADCYRDRAIELAYLMEKKAKEAERAESSTDEPKRTIRIKAGLDVYFRSQRVNNDTITTDEEVMALVRKGFPMTLTERVD